MLQEIGTGIDLCQQILLPQNHQPRVIESAVVAAVVTGAIPVATLGTTQAAASFQRGGQLGAVMRAMKKHA